MSELSNKILQNTNGCSLGSIELAKEHRDLEQQLNEAQAQIKRLKDAVRGLTLHDAQVIDTMLNDKAVLNKTSICEEGYMVVDKWSMLAYVQQLRQQAQEVNE